MGLTGFIDWTALHVLIPVAVWFDLSHGLGLVILFFQLFAEHTT